MFIVKIKLLISSVLLILMFSDIDLLSSFLLMIFFKHSSESSEMILSSKFDKVQKQSPGDVL